MLDNLDFNQRWKNYQSQVQHQLDLVLPSKNISPKRLHDAMRYVCLNGGKRLRAILVYTCGELFNADIEILHVPACAVECMHAYSLTHDDMPAMDDDSLRRGEPTAHVKFDEGTALLAGDALQAFAFELLSNHDAMRELDADIHLKLVSMLSKASGSHGMAGGQGIDLESIGKQLTLSELEIMHNKKTGALIQASALMGCVCGEKISKPEFAIISNFAKHLGLLFQITDDILDEISTDQALGKTAGKDKAADKPTYISLLGLENSREQAQHHHHKAQQNLSNLNRNVEFLTNLNNYVLNRSF